MSMLMRNSALVLILLMSSTTLGVISDSMYQWRTLPIDTFAREGDTVTLRCAVELGAEINIFPEWYKVQRDTEILITDSGKSYSDRCVVTGDTSTGEVNLLFPSVGLEDHGVWICRFPRIINDQSKNAILTVIGDTSQRNSSSGGKFQEPNELKSIGPAVVYYVIGPLSIAATVMIIVVFRQWRASRETKYIVFIGDLTNTESDGGFPK
ncbi:uncharacterized protein [Ptychodera flava]|uniref:uncharacterized protein n=1 Tax=Ptychodera flava TaxID=63121 RepID=UPI00396A8E73